MDFSRLLKFIPNYNSKYPKGFQKIIEAFSEEYNLIDSLFVYTRSCEWEAQNVKDPKLGHCGICWWCQERAWGFSI